MKKTSGLADGRGSDSGRSDVIRWPEAVNANVVGIGTTGSGFMGNAVTGGLLGSVWRPDPADLVLAPLLVVERAALTTDTPLSADTRLMERLRSRPTPSAGKPVGEGTLMVEVQVQVEVKDDNEDGLEHTQTEPTTALERSCAHAIPIYGSDLASVYQITQCRV